MMTIDLKTLTETELHNLLKDANKELDYRALQKEKAAMAECRKIAAGAGLKVSFSGGKHSTPRKKKT